MRAYTVSIAIAAAAMALPGPTSAEPSLRTTNYIVRTRSGPILGHASAQGKTIAYKGIPYAAAPVGPRRWASPAPPTRWITVRDGGAFGPSCPQNPSKADPSEVEATTPVQSEDCLSLNIWKPLDTIRKPLPVLLWIHGGAFQVGSGSLPVYDGSVLAAQGVLVVTINYRMGLLGYMAHPALSAETPHHASGNYALLDQVAALRWLKDNIGVFGGDPARITIAGHSGGGISVGTLMVSPLARGLFAGAIVQSGPLEGLAPRTRTLAQAEKTGTAYMTNRGARTLSQMRALPVSTLLARLPADATAGVALGPVIDGVTIIEPPADTFAAGREAHVPMMIGTASGESGSMTAGSPTPQSVDAFGRLTFGADSVKILGMFPHATDVEARASQAYLKAEPMMAASRAQAALHARTGAATWWYVWDHAPPGPDSDWQRAYHGSELPFIFGTLDTKPRAWTAADRVVATDIQRLWTAFITSGAVPLNWPRYISGAPPFRIAALNEIATPLPNPKRLDTYFSPDDLHPGSRPRTFDWEIAPDRR